MPPFEWNADQAKASRAKVAALMKETGAALWIEHDIATHAKLPKAPSSSNDSIAYHIERFGK